MPRFGFSRNSHIDNCMKKPIDIDEIAVLFQENYGFLCSVAARFVPTGDLVYDVLQQVFIDFVGFVEKYDDCDPRRDAGPVLHHLTKIRAIETWRNERRFTPSGIVKIADRISARLDKDDTEESDRNKDELRALDDCVRQLSGQARMLVHRFYFQKTSLEEIALQMKAKAPTLRKNLTRIRRALAECVKKTLYEKTQDEKTQANRFHDPTIEPE